jgi:polyisoprenoid-binding protein YceI
MAIYNFEPTHTSAQFSARHMMLTNVRGEFRTVTGTLSYDPANPNASTVEAQIDVKSMGTTGVAQRDAHILSADFLDAEKFPFITFKSTSVEIDGDSGKVHGHLTIKDVTKPVVLNVEKLGEAKSPWGQTVLGFNGSTKINREDFGLTWNVALETGGWLVGKDIKIELEVEAIQVEETQPA